MVTDGGDNINHDHADWALARIECGGGGGHHPAHGHRAHPRARSDRGRGASSRPTATFSEAMDPATLTTTTFTLVKQGQTTPLAATSPTRARSRPSTRASNLRADTDLHRHRQGRRLRGEGCRREPARRRLELELHDRGGRGHHPAHDHRAHPRPRRDRGRASRFARPPPSPRRWIPPPSPPHLHPRQAGHGDPGRRHRLLRGAPRPSTRAPLDAYSIYTATVKGGASGAKDIAGDPLAADSSWSFTTGTDRRPRPT